MGVLGMPRYFVGDMIIAMCEKKKPGIILCFDIDNISYVVQVAPEDHHDDGLRELTEDQIEGKG
jgi:hypothetical protein